MRPFVRAMQIAIDRGLPMYNVNPDITVNNPQGGRWFMPGLLSKNYEAMGGVVHYFGKPHKVTPRHHCRGCVKQTSPITTEISVVRALRHCPCIRGRAFLLLLRADVPVQW